MTAVVWLANARCTIGRTKYQTQGAGKVSLDLPVQEESYHISRPCKVTFPRQQQVRPVPYAQTRTLATDCFFCSRDEKCVAKKVSEWQKCQGTTNSSRFMQGRKMSFPPILRPSCGAAEPIWQELGAALGERESETKRCHILSLARMLRKLLPAHIR